VTTSAWPAVGTATDLRFTARDFGQQTNETASLRAVNRRRSVTMHRRRPLAGTKTVCEAAGLKHGWISYRDDLHSGCVRRGGSGARTLAPARGWAGAAARRTTRRLFSHGQRAAAVLGLRPSFTARAGGSGWVGGRGRRLSGRSGGGGHGLSLGRLSRRAGGGGRLLGLGRGGDGLGGGGLQGGNGPAGERGASLDVVELSGVVGVGVRVLGREARQVGELHIGEKQGNKHARE